MIKIMDKRAWRMRAIDHAMELTKVKKQLAIAVEALKIYADKNNWDNHFTIETNDCEFDIISFIEGTDKDGEFYAEQALQQIKELDNGL